MKKLLRFIPIRLTLFLILGILFGSFYDVQSTLLVAFLLVVQLLFLIVYLISNKQLVPTKLVGLLTFILSFFIGVASITFNNQQKHKQHYTNNPVFVTDKPISGVISIRKVLKPTLYYERYEATMLQLNRDRTIGKILVNIEKESFDNYLDVDDEFLVKSVFYEIDTPQNPYVFDYKRYLQKQQIHHQLFISNKHYLKILQPKRTIKGIASKIRKKINKSLKNDGFKNNELAIINALLLGQRQTVNSDLQQNYADAGVIHILAVSGLHVGILLLFLTFLLKPLHLFRHGKLISSFVIILILWAYAIIAGLSASVIRAVSMFTAVSIGMFLNRPSNVYNTLVLSMFFLLLFNPYYLFEVGFQLSYIAVFSIVWIQPKLSALWKSKYWLFQKLWQLFTVSTAAQIGVLPLSLFYFHQFPGLFFLSNLVIVPFLGVLLVAGFLVMSLSVFDLLPHYVGNSYGLLIQHLNNFVAWVSEQELFIIQNITFSLAMMLSFYVLIILFLKWLEKKLLYRLVLLLFSVIVIQSVSIFEKFKRESTKEFIAFHRSKMSIIGIRNGNNLLISTPIDSLDINENIIKPYVIGSGVNAIVKKSTKSNLYVFDKEVILVVDSLGIYRINAIRPTMVLLQHSPKINMERLLYELHPKLVIADGSNYKSFTEKWKETCLKNKTPFFSTAQKGAFILKE